MNAKTIAGRCKYITILYTVLHGMVSVLFLTRYPFVHSDESWLFGLTRDMRAARSLAVTESFFNAKVRYPHAIKSFYHLLQMAFMAVFGDTVFAVRLLSLVCGVLFLYLFFSLLKRLTGNETVSFLVMAAFSLDTWFLYVTHFARQEIFILFFMAVALFVWTGQADAKEAGVETADGNGIFTPPLRRAVLAAVFTGLAIGFHPNSFLIATTTGCVLLATKEGRGKALAVYAGVTALFAAAFVGISYTFGPHFLKNYFAYGAADFGLDSPPVTRLREFGVFFARLWKRESGTYYIPESRYLFLLCGAALAGTLYLAVKHRDVKSRQILAGFSGLAFGIYIMGRFNQLAFVFLLLFGYLATGRCLVFLPACRKEASADTGRPGGWENTGFFPPRKSGTPAKFVAVVLCAALGLGSVLQIAPWLRTGTYGAYLEELSKSVPKDAKTLANLNTGFYFEQGKLIDLRNLPYAVLEDNAPSDDETRYQKLCAYLEETGIEYIVYSSELDYLYEHRPYYNVIYGNAVFVHALKRFCEERCEETASFTDLQYGARVINIMGDPAYSRVSVYRVLK